MRCLVFAYSDIGYESLRTLLDLGQDVVGVVTHKDNPDEVQWWRSVEDLAVDQNIPVIVPDNPNTPEVLAWARDRRPDIVFSFYYRLMLKEPLLALAPKGAYNLHGSLLPKFRGRAPVNWAIIEGATVTGLTLHEMVVKPDAGDIIAQESVPIDENDTARDVFEKLVPVSRRLLTSVVPLLSESRASRRSQNVSESSYFGARTPEDGRIDWAWPALRVHNLVRALARPYPGAFVRVDGKKLYIWKGAPLKGESSGSPGTLLAATSDGVPVVTGDGAFIVKEVQWDGDPIQPARDVLTSAFKFSAPTVDASGQR